MLNDQSITSPHNEPQRSPGFFQKRPPEVFFKKMCSWKFRKFHMKSPVLEPLFNNVAGLQACNFIEKMLQHWCFPMKFVKFLVTPILKNIRERLFLGAWGGGGSSICRWTGNEDFQYGISRFWEKYGRETVFSALDGAGNYWKKQREIGIWNNKKRYCYIWASFKKTYILLLPLVRFLEHFEDFWNLRMLCCNMQMLIYFYTSFINETFEHLMYCDKEKELVFVAFWQTFFKLSSNTFKI